MTYESDGIHIVEKNEDENTAREQHVRQLIEETKFIIAVVSKENVSLSTPTTA